MLTVYIDGVFRAHCNNLGEAMSFVEKWARPYNLSWKVVDGFQATVAQG